MKNRLNPSFYVRVGKRWLDVAASFAGLLVLSPLFLFVAVAISLDSPGSPFFLQERVGKLGKAFRIVKFRSMRVASENTGALITASGDSRITRVGKWLRKTKADELPQLWNVLLGDMSLVGPRPEVPRYTALYTPDQRRVLELRPGITGPAAIAYANEEEILSRQADREAYYVQVLLPAKLEIDLHYCRTASLRTDLNFVLGTFRRLLGQSAPSSQNGNAPSPRSLEETS
jgi:lipopolysaccharide/colanic/teichoic acid biosynthesis glycosyltransferase